MGDVAEEEPRRHIGIGFTDATGLSLSLAARVAARLYPFVRCHE